MTLTAYRAFLDQLATLLASGIPILEALATLGRSQHGGIAGAATDLGERIAAGSSLGKAMASGPFPAGHAAAVDAAERTGSPGEMLVKLRDEVDRHIAARRALLRQLAYPSFLLVACALLPPLYLFFQGRTGEYVLLQVEIFGAAAAAIAAFAALRGPAMSLAGRVPILGHALRRLDAGRSVSLLGTLVGAGVPIRSAVAIAADAAGNAQVAAALLRAGTRIEAGDAFAAAIVGLPGLDPLLLSTITTGEHSGTLERALASAGRALEEGGTRSIGILLRVLPFVVYGIAAIIIGTMYVNAFAGLYGGLLG